MDSYPELPGAELIFELTAWLATYATAGEYINDPPLLPHLLTSS